MDCSLTGGESAPKEHVEEVFRRDVGFEASVELKASSVGLAGAAWLLPARQVVLPSLCWVAQHCISVPNLCRKKQNKSLNLSLDAVISSRLGILAKKCQTLVQIFYLPKSHQ